MPGASNVLPAIRTARAICRSTAVAARVTHGAPAGGNAPPDGLLPGVAPATDKEATVRKCCGILNVCIAALSLR